MSASDLVCHFTVRGRLLLDHLQFVLVDRNVVAGGFLAKLLRQLELHPHSFSSAGRFADQIEVELLAGKHLVKRAGAVLLSLGKRMVGLSEHQFAGSLDPVATSRAALVTVLSGSGGASSSGAFLWRASIDALQLGLCGLTAAISPFGSIELLVCAHILGDEHTVPKRDAVRPHCIATFLKLFVRLNEASSKFLDRTDRVGHIASKNTDTSIVAGAAKFLDAPGQADDVGLTILGLLDQIVDLFVRAACRSTACSRLAISGRLAMSAKPKFATAPAISSSAAELLATLLNAIQKPIGGVRRSCAML